MFEFEDMSAGFHDVFLSKYTDSSGPILDLYISDSMQDMLDIDIRSEVATVVGGTNEFSSLINDLPSLELDSNSNDGEASWLGGPKWSATNHADFYADVGACVNPNSVMPIITSSLLTSPKSQINLNTNNYRQNLSSPPPSPKENKSHLTFSPNQIKVIPTSLHDIRKPSQLSLPNHTDQLETVKKDLRNIVTSLSNNNNTNERKSLINNQQNNNYNNSVNSKILNGRTLISSSTNNHQLINVSNTIKLAPGIGGLTFANNFAYTKLKQQNLKQINSSSQQSTSSNINGNNIIIKRERDSSSPLQNNINNLSNNSNYTNGNILPQNSTNNNKILSRNILIQNKNLSTINGSSPICSPNSSSNNNTKNNNNKPKPLTGQEFPKPAYSYSCLIAMALKNSRSGSLPVSEIYSFMCEHFPYFKTAPNGWKNSVRHNLSLNKCFEKIEKPATNGGQRKGCLWAMNPTKITKMDEEVQKWSRKDPMAIRKAMVYPEHLEALERGEMKHGSTGESDNENDGQSDIEETSDLGEDNEMDETLVETQESMEEEDDDQQDRDFEIEVQDIYDAIDLEDDKESLRIRQNDIIEYNEKDFSSPKRARLDVNYSIAPAGSFKQHNTQIKQEIRSPHHQQLQVHQHQQTTHHSRRKMQLVNRIA